LSAIRPLTSLAIRMARITCPRLIILIELILTIYNALLAIIIPVVLFRASNTVNSTFIKSVNAFYARCFIIQFTTSIAVFMALFARISCRIIKRH